MPDTANNDLTNALSAVSTLIGYIGTEVATSQCFDRVVWPQRSYNNFTVRNAWKAALLMPLGGPLQTAAIKTIDALFKNGLMRGARLGHMLGTCFFPDSALEYQLYENGVACGGVGHVRNGIWPRILRDLPMVTPASQRRHEDEEEQRQDDDTSRRKLSETRQWTPVSHLSITVAKPDDDDDDARRPVVIEGDIDAVTLRTFLAIITSEITGLAVSIVVATVWKSAWMVLWLAPLILKLIAACCAIPRHRFTPETLPSPPSSGEDGEQQEGPPKASFYLENGQELHIIEGPVHIIRPFFRHYGHPQRQRWSEIVQIAVVIAFGINFPIGLVVSILCMSVPLQCMWTGYVLYVTIALYISRYTRGESWLTTEERIAEALVFAEKHPGQTRTLFKAAEGCMLQLELSRSVHNSFGLAKQQALRLLRVPVEAETLLPSS
ncbi:hypothetical protein BJY01DRAFT_221130 [Aspergillus pseudoustus]|uniref:Uncharacterized protein n=1 Tax=Aspergillus pseudoustus TaxID=1810923 RepID=A0ABR4JB59_9EURO